MAKKKSTSTAVVKGEKKKPSSSSSAAAAVTVKKKKKKKKKKKMVTKCNICLQFFKTKHLDKHMHSHSHHKAIERLKGGEQMHMCWACDVSVPGLQQFSKHIECQVHISKILLLQQRRKRGFPVDYNDEELNVLSGQSRFLLKKQKQQEDMNNRKERMFWMKGFDPARSHAAKWTWIAKNSVTCPSNNENKQATTNAGAVPESAREERTWTKPRYWQTFKSFTRSTTKDKLDQLDIISPQEEQDRVRLEQKRSYDVNTFGFPPVKKQCLGKFTSQNPRLFPSGPGPDYMSRILTHIRASPDEERLNIRSSEAQNPETMLSDVPPFSSEPPQMSRKSQECKTQTREIERTSSPYKHEDNLPTSIKTNPQEKEQEPTQEPGRRQVLPTLLSRSVSKTEASKPNLRMARGMRSSQKPGQDAKTRVLKPALQKLISSKSSQWRVNWKEMYQEATHRKLQKEKGMPRKQKQQEDMNNRKERMFWMKGFDPARSHAAKWTWIAKNSVTCPSNNENKQATTNAGAVPESAREERTWTKPRYWQTFKSFTRSTTKDKLDQLDIISPQEEQDRVRLEQKRSYDVNTFGFPPVKKQCLGKFTSQNPRLFPSGPGPDYMSRILTHIRASPDEERLNIRSSEAQNPETMLSDVPPFSSEPPQMSRKSQECKTQTREIERTSSPYKHEDNLPTSIKTNPQEKEQEPTQEPGRRQVLPTLLSRSVSKTEASKPNLRMARGMRSSQKPGQDAKTRVLKPALQKLISSKSSQWRVNWKEMYQEATHRKLQKEKGMPRFGIELVTPLPPEPQEDDREHFELDEGFQWASIEGDPLTLPGFSADAEGQDCRSSSTNRASWPTDEKKADVGENPGASGTSRSSEFVADRLENGDLGDENTSETRRNATPLESVDCVEMEKSNDDLLKTTLQKSDHDGLQSIPTTQIKQEKQDFPHTDTLSSNLPKSRVNELLVMSLREVKLYSSLEDVDSRLLRAQAALQTAFLEVQRLQMIKQQVTSEMSSLRIKRIAILRRIKNSNLDETADADSPGLAV